MSIEIHTAYSDNITGKGPDQYRSQRFTVEATKRLLLKEEPSQQAALLFQICRNSVEAEVAKEKSNQAFKSITPKPEPRTNTTPFEPPKNNNSQHPVSAAQLKYIFDLGAQLGMKSEQVNILPTKFFGSKSVLTQITSYEASKIIEMLHSEIKKAA